MPLILPLESISGDKRQLINIMGQHGQPAGIHGHFCILLGIWRSPWGRGLCYGAVSGVAWGKSGQARGVTDKMEAGLSSSFSFSCSSSSQCTLALPVINYCLLFGCSSGNVDVFATFAQTQVGFFLDPGPIVALPCE